MTFQEIKLILQQVITDNSYTITNVRNLTKQQIANILGVGENDAFWSNGNKGFYKNLKSTILRKMQDDIDETDKTFLGEQLEGGARTVMRSRFPNFIVVRRKIQGRRILEIHLDGISTEEP